MRQFRADLHVHLGRAGGKPVKITASPRLTLENILAGAKEKGLNIVGIVDAAAPQVLDELDSLVENNFLIPLETGGLSYKGEVTLLLGCELETKEGRNTIHWVSFFPNRDRIREFADRLKGKIKNLSLSSQRCRLSAGDLASLTVSLDGIFFPAHIFTPFKGFYAGFKSLTEVFPMLDQIAAVELGLSADSNWADHLSELGRYTFLSSSDAHSLIRLGREYNVFCAKAPTFVETVKVLSRSSGRYVAANYGLDPRFGKYHRTRCLDCGSLASGTLPVSICTTCGSRRVIKGVLDRILEISDFKNNNYYHHRPPYHYQVPLADLPRIGPVTMQRLLREFHSEPEILHEVAENDLVKIVGERVARIIINARKGKLNIEEGGGGTYGKARE